MKNTSLQKFKDLSAEQLGAQTTRALTEALAGSRQRAKPEDGEELSDSQAAFNQSQAELEAQCKAALATRDHLPRSTKQEPRKQKKTMAY